MRIASDDESAIACLSSIVQPAAFLCIRLFRDESQERLTTQFAAGLWRRTQLDEVRVRSASLLTMNSKTSGIGNCAPSQDTYRTVAEM